MFRTIPVNRTDRYQRRQRRVRAMAISLTPFERQFTDLGEAIRTGRKH
jgi:hypothetical protein